MKENQKSKSGENLSQIMTNYYMDLHTKASEGAFVIWIAIIVPAEIFSGFDNVVYGVPESHAALCAGKGSGIILCEEAEQMGYSIDLCSYSRIDIGSAFNNGKNSPTFGLPKPDLLISNNNNCSLLVKWFDIYHRKWNIPHFIMDIPFCYEKQKKKDFEYIINQFHELIDFIKKISGQSFNIEKVKQAVHNTNEAFKHWKRFMDFAKHKPSGITAFDSFVQMAPILTMRGTNEMISHFNLLADETKELIESGSFPVENEKYRLLWDNIAPWHQLRKMSKRLAKLSANIISSSYTYCIGCLEGEYNKYFYSGQNPLEYLARIQNFSICPHGLSLRTNAMLKAIKDMDIDGVIFASNRSCKVYSIMQMDQQRLISQKCNIPAVMIDVDHADVRKYDEESTFNRIETLLEIIDETKNN